MSDRRPRVRVCLFGLGRAGSVLHLPALRRIREIEIVAACDPDPEARARAGRTRLIASVDEALGLPYDAAIVATPVSTHQAVAAAALAAGRHVYVEKPMTSSLRDAHALAEQARASGLVVQVGYAYRFHPLWQRVRRLVDDGLLTPPFHARGAFSTARAGAGWAQPLVDVATHHVDLVSWLTGATPVAVDARRDGQLGVRWDDGSELDGLYQEASPQDSLELEDDRQCVVVDRLRATRLRLSGPRPASAVLPSPVLVRARLGRSGWEPSFERALRGFVCAIRAGTPAAPGVEAGVAGVAVAEAVLQSLATGQTAAVPARDG